MQKSKTSSFTTSLAMRQRILRPLLLCALFGLALVHLPYLSGVRENNFTFLHLILFALFFLVQFAISEGLANQCRQLISRHNTSFTEARKDSLTGLPNRKALLEAMARLGEEQSLADHHHYLVILDLDRFKSINDGFGHQAGDLLLQTLGERLRRIGDAHQHEAFRLSGDEFALLIETKDHDHAINACGVIRQEIIQPYDTDLFYAVIGCSLGVALVDPAITPSEVMRRADLAMYSAKKAAGAVALFDDAMMATVRRKADLSSRLRAALLNEEGMSAKFQIILSDAKEIVSFEALFRWLDQSHGHIGAQEAIEIARDNHLLNEISTFMVRSSTEVLRSFPNTNLCLNVEATQLLDSCFSTALTELVDKNYLPRSRIQLEIRESDFVEFGTQMSSVLQDLHDLGFVIAVDDFGSSNASLTFLKQLGVTELKFDRTVLESARETESIAVMKAKVDLAKSLGLGVTCKGIIDEQDEAIALQTGCDYLQGFRYCRPDCAQTFTKFVNAPIELVA